MVLYGFRLFEKAIIHFCTQTKPVYKTFASVTRGTKHKSKSLQKINESKPVSSFKPSKSVKPW